MRGTRFEVTTSGFDENLQLVNGDPYAVGLRVPSTPTTSKQNPYLFMLARHRVPAHARVRLVGMRQMLTIGQIISQGEQAPQSYPYEQQVVTPFWGFVDAKVSWHLRRLKPMQQNVIGGPSNSDGFMFRDSDTPALLYESVTAYGGGGTPCTGYVPPLEGFVPGEPLVPGMSTFRSLEFPWNAAEAWKSMDVQFEGPCDIALFAKVPQTNINNRARANLGASFPVGTQFLTPEDAAVATYSSLIYWRVAGSLIFQTPNMYRETSNPESKDR